METNNQAFSIPLPQAVADALSALENAGYEAFIVGGCVRDALLGREPKDYDITTSALPEEVERVFCRNRVIETGLRHGTVTVLSCGEPLEITTYRTDGDYSDHRHPDGVTFTRTLTEDLARRDFTVNAMAYSPDVGLINPFGGLNDLHEKRLRCVGDPDHRFQEDALRILRLLRFSAVLGFSPEENTLRAAERNMSDLRYVSAERIFTELKKLLCGKNACEVLMRDRVILAQVIPEFAPMFDFDQRNPHHHLDVWAHSVAALSHVPPEPTIRIAALLHDIGKPSCFTVDENRIGHCYGHAQIGAEIAEEILLRLKSDRATQTAVCDLIRFHDRLIEPNERSVRRALQLRGSAFFFDLMRLKRADNLAQAPEFRSRQTDYDVIEQMAHGILERADCLSLSDLAVNGDDLKGIGIPSGRTMGAVLRHLLEQVTDDHLPNEKNALLTYAAALPPDFAPPKPHE